MDGWTEGQINGWMGGWMDGTKLNLCKHNILPLIKLYLITRMAASKNEDAT